VRDVAKQHAFLKVRLLEVDIQVLDSSVEYSHYKAVDVIELCRPNKHVIGYVVIYTVTDVDLKNLGAGNRFLFQDLDELKQGKLSRGT